MMIVFEVGALPILAVHFVGADALSSLCEWNFPPDASASKATSTAAMRLMAALAAAVCP